MTEKTKKRIRQFVKDRDWAQYHSPANLAKSISIEANELLECFQWSDTDYNLQHVKEELSDVLVYPSIFWVTTITFLPFFSKSAKYL